MRKLFHYISAIVILSLILSCSPQKRLHRLLALHPELRQKDTIRLQDTTILPGTFVDTLVHYTRLHDTVIIEKEKISLLLHQKNDTVYIQAQRKSDTIIVRKIIPIEKIRYVEPREKKKSWLDYTDNILIILIISLLIILYIRK